VATSFGLSTLPLGNKINKIENIIGIHVIDTGIGQPDRM
jgi:hypothetical protein